MSGSRELILERVRGALADGPLAPESPRDYRRAGTLSSAARTDLFCERAGDYRAEVRRVRAGELPVAIAEVFAARGAQRVCVPTDIASEWRVDGVKFVADEELSWEELDRIDGVLTGCTVAIAETGTIVLSAGAGEGRRAITLIPDLHVCVIEARQIVETVPEAMTLLADLGAQRRPLTFISGPSATSDIELNRVEGVHGPRNLVVLIQESA
jgi:L-lactate dehydrogenase complex protein LldG